MKTEVENRDVIKGITWRLWGNWNTQHTYVILYAVDKICQKKQSEGVRFLLIQQSKHSAILPKIHSRRLLFRRFRSLGMM